jgi:hypothetical protein
MSPEPLAIEVRAEELEDLVRRLVGDEPEIHPRTCGRRQNCLDSGPAVAAVDAREIRRRPEGGPFPECGAAEPVDERIESQCLA